MYPRENNEYLPKYQRSENYYTLSPVIDHQNRLKLYERGKIAYRDQIERNPGKFVEKMYTGSAPIDYPFRNVMPDKL